jgi:putative aminopeptidase FrvX
MKTLYRISILIGALSMAGAALAQADDRTVSLLRALSDAPGISGQESAVRKIMREEMGPLSDAALRYDGLGGVVAVQGNHGPRVMLSAHMDELGGVVRRIDANGFISMQTIGGWLTTSLFGQRWTIYGTKGAFPAVSGQRDMHLDTLATPTIGLQAKEALFLDIGARSDTEVEALGIRPGDAIVPDSKFQVLAGNRYLGKAFDDRIGCAVLVEVMRRLKGAAHPNQVFYTATVQEEVGIRGARPSAAMVQPDVAIALEYGVAADTPESKPTEANSRLGGGPQVMAFNSTTLADPALLELVRKIAIERKIPLQNEVVVNFGDDAGEFQKTGTGVPVITITVPARYAHTHIGVMDRTDFDKTVELVAALVENLDHSTVARIRDFSAR